MQPVNDATRAAKDLLKPVDLSLGKLLLPLVWVRVLFVLRVGKRSDGSDNEREKAQ